MLNVYVNYRRNPATDALLEIDKATNWAASYPNIKNVLC